MTIIITTSSGNEETPLYLLKKRYASGEISTEEYKDIKKMVEN